MGSQSIPLSRRSLIAMGTGALAVAACAPVGRASNELAVYKTPTCACCTAWVDHMRAAGFEARISELPSLRSIRRHPKACPKPSRPVTPP